MVHRIASFSEKKYVYGTSDYTLNVKALLLEFLIDQNSHNQTVSVILH